MTSMVNCSNCGHPNADSAKFCAKCGNKLTPAETLVMGMGDASISLPSAPSAYTPPTPALSAAPSGESTHRYVAMRTIAGLCNILAWISLVLGFLGGLMWGYIIGNNLIGSGFLGVIGGLVAGAISGGLGWIFWRLLGEGIWLALDIEANTRRTAAALEEQRRA